MIKTKRLPAYYPELLKALKYYVPDWLNGIRRFTARLFLQYNPHLLGNPKDFGIREEFAVMDLKKHVLMHRYLLSLNAPKKWLSSIHQADMMMSCMPCTVDTNYFLPIFTHGLGGIYESGLYHRWNNYHDDMNGLDNFNQILERSV